MLTTWQICTTNVWGECVSRRCRLSFNI